MKHRSTLNSVLILAGLAVATLGAYKFGRFLIGEPAPTFSTNYYQEVPSIPFPASQGKVAAKLSGHIHSFAVSPDLKTIAMATSQGVALYDLQSYELLDTLSRRENSARVAFSPDGTKLAVGSLIMQNRDGGKPHLVVWDTSSWEVVFEPKIGSDDITSYFGALAWSPDGNFLAASDYGRGLVTFEVETGKVISFQKDFLWTPGDISWSPSGSRIVATGDLGYGFRRWRVETDKWVRLYDQRAAAATQLAWSPDGERIASAHGNGLVCFWTARTNQCDGLIEAHPNFVASLAWSPDGSRLATGGGILRVWDTQTGNMLTSFGLNPVGAIYSQLEWLPDGRLVSLETGYIEAESTVIRFWEMDTGEILTKFVGAGGTFGRE